MLKEGVRIEQKGGICRVYQWGDKKRARPWMGEVMALLYDPIMTTSMFPKKFEASYEKHLEFLRSQLSGFHGADVLELATGSGNLAEVLPPDNRYFGIDVSEGLLRLARRKFEKVRITSLELYSCPAEDLPFALGAFDVAVCNLSLNFFSSLEEVLKELKRVLKPGGNFICSVPVPERNRRGTSFHGDLRSEGQLSETFNSHGFSFSPYQLKNGALLYFKATRVHQARGGK